MTGPFAVKLVFLFLASCFASMVATPLVRRLAWRFNWVDVPDANRKLHAAPIPRVGGIAVFFAYAIGVGLLATIRFDPGDTGRIAHGILLWRLLPAVAAVFLTGLLDDRYRLSPSQKLTGELVGAILACLAGLQIRSIGSMAIPDWIGIPLTLIWLVGCTNAFNLI